MGSNPRGAAIINRSMKKLLLACLLLITTPVYASVMWPSDEPQKGPYFFRIIKVIDGDTVQFDAPFLPVELGQVLSIRILGVDTPEKGSRAHCDKEAALADRASEFTTRVVMSAKTHQIVIKSWDKYGGRVLGDVLLDGQSLSKMLIDNQYALPYDGTKKPDWCK